MTTEGMCCFTAKREARDISLDDDSDEFTEFDLDDYTHRDKRVCNRAEDEEQAEDEESEHYTEGGSEVTYEEEKLNLGLTLLQILRFQDPEELD